MGKGVRRGEVLKWWGEKSRRSGMIRGVDLVGRGEWRGVGLRVTYAPWELLQWFIV